MTRKIVALLLVVALVVAMAVPASATDDLAVASATPYEWYKTYMNNEYNLYFRIIPTGKARIINYDVAPDVTVAVSFASKDEAGNTYSDSDSGSMQAQVTREGAQCFLCYGYAKYKVNGYVIDERTENNSPG